MGVDCSLVSFVSTYAWRYYKCIIGDKYMHVDFGESDGTETRVTPSGTTQFQGELNGNN